MNFRTRPTRAGISHGPKVVLLSPSHNVPWRQICDFFPDLVGLVIVFKNRHPEIGRRQADFPGQKVPGQSNRLILGIIAERKVAEHFKKGVMPGGITNVIQIVMLTSSPNAALTAYRSRVITPLLTGENLLKLHHPGVGEKKGGIIMGDQGRAWHQSVLFCDKVT